MIRYPRIIISLIILFAGISVYSQQTNSVLRGRVLDTTGAGVALVNISIEGTEFGTVTDNSGEFSFIISKNNQDYTLNFSVIGYKSLEKAILADRDTIELNFVMIPEVISINEVVVREQGITDSPTMIRIPTKSIKLTPIAGSAIETILVTMPGVNSSNELSSQYSVRGGSYDENLVYLEGLEIYRPQLINSGRKEGLSLINPDLVSSIYFSTGGFNSSYGDKLSSVLDISYRTPDEFAGSAKLSLMTNSIHLEGSSESKNVTFLFGSRYMTNRHLLKTLDTEANYTPYFYDIQSLITIRTGKKSKLKLFFTYGKNRFEFIPLSQRSSFGTFSEAYQLFVDYDGFESDNYTTINSALTWEWNHSKSLSSKLMVQNSSSKEIESFDIRGRYLLNLLDKNLGSENLGDSIMNIGIGSWLDHARNKLNANIAIVSFNSRWEHSNNILSWGLKYKNEQIRDDIDEWRMIDSAGYSIPYSSSGLELSRAVSAHNELSSYRLESYFLNNYTFTLNDYEIILTAGARFSYWSLNKEILFSPRLSVEMAVHSRLAFYIAGGRYFQAPFYRELRYPDASLNKQIKAQKSTHIVLGSRWDFSLAYTSFRLSGEIYHKQLDDLIPYKFDNVRVVYSAENKAKGNIRGLDLRLNGEFVKGAESWLSVSIMKATHDIKGDEYGPYPAPADIRFSTNLFFQDYLPSNPTYKAHIKLHFSTGMPVSSPYDERFDNYSRMPSYRRVDLGFTKTIKDGLTLLKSGNPLNYLEDVIIGLEVFNLLDINNTISYHWLSTVNNLSGEGRQFAVPNYLTGRSLNLKSAVLSKSVRLIQNFKNKTGNI